MSRTIELLSEHRLAAQFTVGLVLAGGVVSGLLSLLERLQGVAQ